MLLDCDGRGAVKVSLSSKPGTSDDALRAIAGEFQNELLGQVLRQRIATRHEKVREALVARALFGAAPRVTEPRGDAEPPPVPSDEALGLDAKHLPAADDDYLEDPLGIAVPWEEKYGKTAPAPEGGPPAGAAPPARRDQDGPAS